MLPFQRFAMDQVAGSNQTGCPDGYDVHAANPDYAGGVWALVDFDVTPYLGKAVRFNATLPEYLLARIDAYVGYSGNPVVRGLPEHH